SPHTDTDVDTHRQTHTHTLRHRCSHTDTHTRTHMHWCRCTHKHTFEYTTTILQKKCPSFPLCGQSTQGDIRDMSSSDACKVVPAHTQLKLSIFYLKFQILHYSTFTHTTKYS